MEKLLESFEYITDVSDLIDKLVEQASKERKKDKKRELLAEAQKYADAYNQHVGRKAFADLI